MPAETDPAARLRELLAAVPFVPFRVLLRDGRSFVADWPDEFRNGVMQSGFWEELLDYADIASIEPAGEQRHIHALPDDWPSRPLFGRRPIEPAGGKEPT